METIKSLFALWVVLSGLLALGLFAWIGSSILNMRRHNAGHGHGDAIHAYMVGLVAWTLIILLVISFIPLGISFYAKFF